MQLKVPPAILGLLFLFLIGAAPELFPAWGFFIPGWVRGTLAALLLVASTALSVAAIVQFSREHTTVDPLRPERASLLVTTGAYAVSRNPMYVGFVATLLAAAVWLAHPLSLALVLVFAVVLQRVQIRPEERILEEQFGDTYRDYRSRVRRWL
jgi:protein-S-isoprenylcysteine O-methyltransferase Ste14